MRFNTLVQLRDCLVELLDFNNAENGVSQGAFLFQTLRRLLTDNNTKMDLQGLSNSISDLPVGLLTRCGRAFAVGIKQLQSSKIQHRESTEVSLEEIFQIMCSQGAFDSPIVLCAAYIALLRSGAISPQIVECFRREVSKLDVFAYDAVLQELLAMARLDLIAIDALLLATGSASEGFHCENNVNDRKRYIFRCFQTSFRTNTSFSDNVFLGHLRWPFEGGTANSAGTGNNSLISTNFLAESCIQMEFRPSHCQSHHSMFSDMPTTIRYSWTRRNLRRHRLRYACHITTLPQTSHLEISSYCTNVANHGSRLCENLIHGTTQNPRHTLPSTTLANKLLFNLIRPIILPYPCHVGQSTFNDMAHKSLSRSKTTTHFKRCKNRKSSIQTCSVVYDGVCSITSRISRFNDGRTGSESLGARITCVIQYSRDI
jgi:hypothetical protein